MVSILYRKCRQRLSLDHENWATMSAPATNKKTLSPSVAGFFIARRDSL